MKFVPLCVLLSLCVCAPITGSCDDTRRPHPDTHSTNTATPADALDPELRTALKTAPAAAAWPDSDYVRLLDIGKVTVQSDGTVISEYRVTMKLFNQRARALAEVNLPFNASYQSIKVLKARTIKKDGTVLSVRPDDLRVSSPFTDYLMYDDAQAMGFSLPGIEDDCIIDYTWQEITRPLLMPGQFWTYWRFNGEEPVLLSRYTLTAPAEKSLRFKVLQRRRAASRRHACRQWQDQNLPLGTPQQQADTRRTRYASRQRRVCLDGSVFTGLVAVRRAMVLGTRPPANEAERGPAYHGCKTRRRQNDRRGKGTRLLRLGGRQNALRRAGIWPVRVSAPSRRRCPRQTLRRLQRQSDSADYPARPRRYQGPPRFVESRRPAPHRTRSARTERLQPLHRAGRY